MGFSLGIVWRRGINLGGVERLYLRYVGWPSGSSWSTPWADLPLGRSFNDLASVRFLHKVTACDHLDFESPECLRLLIGLSW